MFDFDNLVSVSGLFILLHSPILSIFALGVSVTALDELFDAFVNPSVQTIQQLLVLNLPIHQLLLLAHNIVYFILSVLTKIVESFLLRSIFEVQVLLYFSSFFLVIYIRRLVF